MKNNKQFKTKKAFTMIEMIVVMAVVTMITAWTIPSMIGIINETKMKTEIANARLVYVAAQAQITEDYIKGKDISKIIYNETNKNISNMLKNDMVLGEGNVKFNVAKNGFGWVTRVEYENNGKKVNIIDLEVNGEPKYGTIKIP